LHRASWIAVCQQNAQVTRAATLGAALSDVVGADDVQNPNQPSCSGEIANGQRKFVEHPNSYARRPCQTLKVRPPGGRPLFLQCLLPFIHPVLYSTRLRGSAGIIDAGCSACPGSAGVTARGGSAACARGALVHGTGAVLHRALRRAGSDIALAGRAVRGLGCAAAGEASAKMQAEAKMIFFNVRPSSVLFHPGETAAYCFRSYGLQPSSKSRGRPALSHWGRSLKVPMSALS
jgi:hypothetical protein